MVNPKACCSKRAPSDDEETPSNGSNESNATKEDANVERDPSPPSPPIPIGQIMGHLEALVAHLTHQVLEAKIELDQLIKENETIKGPFVAVINRKRECIAQLTEELEKCEREKAALDERNAQLERQIEELEAAQGAAQGAAGGKKSRSR